MTSNARSNPPRTLADLRRDVAEQTEDFSSLFDATPEADLVRRPPDGKWSAVEHVDHLIKVNRRYAEALEDALAQGRAGGRTGSGPFRGSVIGRFFARSMEPPVKMRVKTMAAMLPDAELAPGPTLVVFRDIQAHLDRLLGGAHGLDLDAIRMASPFARLLRAPVFSWFVVVTAHTRRHLWLTRETLSRLDDSAA